MTRKSILGTALLAAYLIFAGAYIAYKELYHPFVCPISSAANDFGIECDEDLMKEDISARLNEAYKRKDLSACDTLEEVEVVKMGTPEALLGLTGDWYMTPTRDDYAMYCKALAADFAGDCNNIGSKRLRTSCIDFFRSNLPQQSADGLIRASAPPDIGIVYDEAVMQEDIPAKMKEAYEKQDPAVCAGLMALKPTWRVTLGDYVKHCKALAARDPALCDNVHCSLGNEQDGGVVCRAFFQAVDGVQSAGLDSCLDRFEKTLLTKKDVVDCYAAQVLEIYGKPFYETDFLSRNPGQFSARDWDVATCVLGQYWDRECLFISSMQYCDIKINRLFGKNSVDWLGDDEEKFSAECTRWHQEGEEDKKAISELDILEETYPASPASICDDAAAVLRAALGDPAIPPSPEGIYDSDLCKSLFSAAYWGSPKQISFCLYETGETFFSGEGCYGEKLLKTYDGVIEMKKPQSFNALDWDVYKNRFFRPAEHIERFSLMAARSGKTSICGLIVNYPDSAERLRAQCVDAANGKIVQPQPTPLTLAEIDFPPPKKPHPMERLLTNSILFLVTP